MILGAAFVVKDTNEGSNVDARFTATLNPWSLLSNLAAKASELADALTDIQGSFQADY